MERSIKKLKELSSNMTNRNITWPKANACAADTACRSFRRGVNIRQTHQLQPSTRFRSGRKDRSALLLAAPVRVTRSHKSKGGGMLPSHKYKNQIKITKWNYHPIMRQKK